MTRFECFEDDFNIELNKDDFHSERFMPEALRVIAVTVDSVPIIVVGKLYTRRGIASLHTSVVCVNVLCKCLAVAAD